MSERTEEAIATAWEIYASGGNGEGWTIADCFTAITIGAGCEVTEEQHKRMQQINPTLAAYAAVARAPAPTPEATP